MIHFVIIVSGQRKCIKPKCELPNTKCKVSANIDCSTNELCHREHISQPIFMDASCCPVKYDCASNATSAAALTHHSTSVRGLERNKHHSSAKRRNRSEGMISGYSAMTRVRCAKSAFGSKRINAVSYFDALFRML